jgi:small subunit ribosomal protein S5e
MRRVSQSLYYMAMGARNATMKNYRSMSECLADELMNCEKMSPNSYAIKKKDEIEKVAKGNR